MTSATRERTPPHLRKYIVNQNYERYTPEDQAVWRYIMRQLKSFLSEHAHRSYLEGLKKTGIRIERIPRIDEVDESLEKLGWGAVPVSGFIPPAAFMEFQSLGILPIASDMRSIGHLLYTPAPDIVHEAAGHAPILADPAYAHYLRQYGEVARHSIISREDLDQYEAIRVLSDVKENPQSSASEIAAAEARLNEITRNMKFVSEAALLSRMNWWTAEYGLIGTLANPKIFGAGLLSSVGEARSCLKANVKKIRLSVDCVDFTYDITEPQPQLFVAEDFAQLGAVLNQLADRLAFRRGGIFGLERATEAETVNTVEFESGLQVSGRLKNFIRAPRTGEPAYLQFEGPSQLALDYLQLANQGTAHHPHGYSTPVGLVNGRSLEPGLFKKSERMTLKFDSGVEVTGQVRDLTFAKEKLVLVTWVDCRVQLGDQLLFDPSWGEYDMAVGALVNSVFGGPADRSQYGDTQDFVTARVPDRRFSDEERRRNETYSKIRNLRERAGDEALNEWRSLADKVLKAPDATAWLPALELIELSEKIGVPPSERETLRNALGSNRFADPSTRQSIEDGLALAQSEL